METTEQVEQEIDALRLQRVLLSSQLSVEMENYWNDVPLSKENIDKLKMELSNLDDRLMPLQLKYENN